MSSVKKIYGIKTTDKETLRRWYYLLYLGRCLDEKAPSYLLQSIGWQFHASNAGHDGIQLAIGQIFQRGKDHLFLYYRDLLAALSAGMTVEEMILNGISKATDPTSAADTCLTTTLRSNGVSTTSPPASLHMTLRL